MAGRLGDPIIYGDETVYLIDVQLRGTQQIPPPLCLSGLPSSSVVGEIPTNYFECITIIGHLIYCHIANSYIL